MKLSSDSRPFTVQGITLQIPLPEISEGHVCTEGEASSLKQTFVENVRNNIAGDIKEMKEKGASENEMQNLINEYASEYEFNVRTGGFRVADPVEAAAREIALEYAKRVVRKSGKSLKDYGMDALRADAERALEDPNVGPKIRAKAEKVAAAKSEALEL